MKTKQTLRIFSATSLLLAIWLAVPAYAQTSPEAKELNLYSARHYKTDEALYGDFTKKTGIKINRIEADDNALAERLKSEGANSPADVILMVDAARLWRAQIDGFFKPIQSKYLESRIPENLRSKPDPEGSTWFGFSTRARLVVYNKDKVNPQDVDTYEKLAEPMNKGKVCTRSGAHPYMLSLIGAMIERRGEAATEAWAKGMVANMARPPRGGDTDQIKAVASGECGVALANSYYLVRLLRSNKPEDQAIVSKIGFVWPNQKTSGAHINIAGGGVAKNAPHSKAAVQFLEYLASDSAQEYFANGNNEWPVVKSVKIDNEGLKMLGPFKAENISVAAIGRNQIAAQRLLDRVGYK
ncbi:MAG: Fe(3+) ABC transporter substrate-binding protein [Polynucleobacter sp. 17-46-58]|jgi:iron(III) transport system substrate-binding protein|nr:MAG: Fe(3+) ABC transporter substrate-binding protein [Polynucleobacter sp. 16-46-70]OZA41222.1 MAG: Fe(3+) ABC transporter substrate-binding protein [Polynucleobacter sp. 17-46-58]HQR83756.1 Fe(3+) ABC transporter substrate-binding protein [Polynucleobacter sp.]HQS61350.1 Fe(3+) ABC transporter substrate-binding protein [Polynucleobacter sp.]HQT20084.1 Fe(3+) ABC transporter substrate-binding protein [Polynucleobacter sp.]